jgi:hypothetical protein
MKSGGSFSALWNCRLVPGYLQAHMHGYKADLEKF